MLKFGALSCGYACTLIELFNDLIKVFFIFLFYKKLMGHVKVDFFFLVSQACWFYFILNFQWKDLVFSNNYSFVILRGLEIVVVGKERN